MSAITYPFADLHLCDEESAELKAAAASVIDSGRFIGGEEVAAFESELGRFCSVEHIVGVSNGLDALSLIFRAYKELGRLADGDEVIVPANTYIASVLAVTNNNLIPVLVEPSEETLNLDTALIERHITPATKAILTVHLYGRCCYDSTLKDLASRYGLLVIEDNAQAIGATSSTPSPWDTTATGSLGDASAFSFYPTKNLGAIGDAGAVGTHDPELAAAVRALANYGSDRRYHNIYQGSNCRLDTIQAAFLRVKLARLDKETLRRHRLAMTYSQCINNPLITKPLMQTPDSCVWHQYVIRCDSRDSLQRYLTANGVGTDIHYATPPHLQPCYHDLAHGPLPRTERMASQVLSLPVSPCTSEDDARCIADIINSFRK